MTACSDDQFTCQDGFCISMKERCDGQIQCLDWDGSDEEDCQLVFLNPGYNKVVVPAGPDGLLQLTMDIFIRNNKTICKKKECLKLYSHFPHLFEPSQVSHTITTMTMITFLSGI